MQRRPAWSDVALVQYTHIEAFAGCLFPLARFQNSYTPGKAGGMIMNRPRRFPPT
jgi:hypothetical protein